MNLAIIKEYLFSFSHRGRSMYSVNKALGIPFGISKGWELVDTPTLTMKEIYNRFRKVIFVLTQSPSAQELYLDFEYFRSQYGSSESLFAQVLVDNGTTTLPVVTTRPYTTIKTAVYNDGFTAGYNAIPYHRLYGVGVPSAMRNDLLITSTTVRNDLKNTAPNYDTVYNSCLFTVNGLFHISDKKSQGIVVYNGCESGRIANNNTFGIYSFYNVGQITQLPITEAMLSRQSANVSMYEKTKITLTQDISDKTVFLVMGGYFHTLDGSTVYRASDSSIIVCPEKLSLLSRHYESKHYLNLTSLPLTDPSGSVISMQEFTADACMKAYLTLSQSFIVVLNKTDVFVNRYYIENPRLPRSYVSFSKPIYPLVTGLGRTPEYIATREEDNRWNIMVNDSTIPNLIYKSATGLNSMTVTDDQLPSNPAIYSPAYLLEIGVGAPANVSVAAAPTPPPPPPPVPPPVVYTYSLDQTNDGMSITPDSTEIVYTVIRTGSSYTRNSTAKLTIRYADSAGTTISTAVVTYLNFIPGNTSKSYLFEIPATYYTNGNLPADKQFIAIVEAVA